MPLWCLLVYKNWASNRLRSLLTLLGISLGVAIVVAIYVMDHNTIQSRLLLQNSERGRVDLEVRPSNPQTASAAVLSDLQQRSGVVSVGLWHSARGQAQSAKLTMELAVFGLAPVGESAFAHYNVAAGRDLASTDGPQGILLGGEAARLLDCKPGDRLSLGEVPAAARVECVDGKMVQVKSQAEHAAFRREVEVVGVLSPDRLGRKQGGLMLVCSNELAQVLTPAGGTVYHLLREPGADLDRLRQELQGGYVVQDFRQALIGEGADERAFRNGLKVLGGLALLLGMYVVFQTLSHSLVSRVRQLGLLRCLGAGSGAITRLFLADAIALGVLGSALGVGLGLLLALGLQACEVSSLGVGKAWSTFQIPWFPVVWTALLGVLFTLAGAMFPLVRARAVPALDILRAKGLAPDRRDGVDLLAGVNGWMFGLLVVALPLAYLAMTPLASEEGQETRMVLVQLGALLGVFGSVLLLAPVLVTWLGRVLLLPLRCAAPLAGWLTDKTLARSGGRVAAAVCGLSAVLLALLGLKSLTASLRAEVDQFAAVTLQDRLFLRVAACEPALARQLLAVPGVTAVELCEGEELGGGFLLRGMAVETVAGVDGALEGDPSAVAAFADERVRRLLVSRRLAKAKNWQTGDYVPMLDRNQIPVTYVVLGIDDRHGFDSDERAYAVAASHWLKRDFCVADACVEHVAVRLQPEADVEAVKAAARSIFGKVSTVKTGEFVHGYFLRDVGRDFVLFDFLLLLMLGLAGIGLLNGMTIAAIGRQRELGVLRALGLARGSMTASFLLEGAVVAALASVLAVALSVPMSHVLVLGMNRVAALDAPVVLPKLWFVWGPLAVLVTALLAAWLPAWRSLRRSPGEAVRYE